MRIFAALRFPTSSRTLVWSRTRWSICAASNNKMWAASFLRLTANRATTHHLSTRPIRPSKSVKVHRSISLSRIYTHGTKNQNHSARTAFVRNCAGTACKESQRIKPQLKIIFYHEALWSKECSTPRRACPSACNISRFSLGPTTW